MTTKLAARQLRQTRAELERAARKQASEKLRALRGALKTARAERRERLKSVTSTCRAARTQIAHRAKQARARLNASIKRTREQARNVCGVARGTAKRETLAKLDTALGALDRERAEQRSLRIWLEPSRASSPSKGGRAREQRAESDDEVAANIDDPGLRIVWEKVKARIKPRARTSRTEVFAEWVAEHAADVYAIQEADAERALHELERQEVLLSKALKRARYTEPPGLSAVPF